MRLCASCSRDDPSDLAPDSCYVASACDGTGELSLPTDVQLVVGGGARPLTVQLIAFSDPDAPVNQVCCP